MKTRNLILPLLATLAIGCNSCTGLTTQAKGTHAPVVVAEAPKPPPVPTVITQDTWTITLPVGWKVDTTVKAPDGGADLHEVLSANSPTPVGRAPVHVELMTTPFDGPEQLFGMIASKVAEESIEGAEVDKRAMGQMEGHIGTLTVLHTPNGLGLVVIAVASSGTGHILTCGGDISTPELGGEVAKECHSVTDSFHVK